jgi:hypothetical protein
MFEGHIKASRADAQGEQGESQHLHQLRWTDLVARLAATRDLRAEMGHTGEAGFASFSASLPELGENSKRDGNQDILRHGKFTGSRPAAAANDAAKGDRDDT